MKHARLCLVALVALLTVPVFAGGVVDDAIKLAQGGVGEDVIVAWAEKTDGGSISADDIITLKNAKVPDRAIATLIRNGALKAAPGNRYIAKDDQGRFIEREDRIQAPVQRDVAPAVAIADPGVQYVQRPVTTVVSPIVYSDVYYSSYYPSYYGGRSCSSYYPSISLGFYGGGYRHSYGSYGGGFRGGFSTGFRGGFGGGFRGGFRR